MARRLNLTSRVASPCAHAPVTTLGLFFDLVFTVTRLTEIVLDPHPSLRMPDAQTFADDLASIV